MDSLLQIIPVPVNSLSWTVGGVVVFLYGLRSWSVWRHSNNSFSRYFALMGIFAGLGLFFYGVTALVSASERAVFLSMIIGFILVDTGLYIHSMFSGAYIKSIPIRRLFYGLLIASGIASITLMALDGHIEQTTHLTLFVMPMDAAYLQSLFLALALFPASIIFFRKAFQYDDKRLQLRSLVFSFSHLTLGGLAIAGYLLNQNRDTEISAVVNLILFIVFGVFVLIVTRHKH